MTDASDPNARFANAGTAHHDAVQKLLQAFRDKSDALKAAQDELEAARAAKAESDTDKDSLSEYLEAVTDQINSEIAPASA